MTKSTINVKQGSFFLGQYDDFLDQEARLYVLNSLYERQSDDPIQDIAKGISHSLQNADTNSQLFAFRSLSEQGLEPLIERARQVAVSTLPVWQQLERPYGHSNDKKVSDLVCWDFSTAINRHLGVVTSDYLMSRATQVLDIDELATYVSKHVVDPIHQQTDIQHEVPVRLMAMMDLKAQVLSSYSSQDFLATYGDILESGAFERSALAMVEQSAMEHQISIPRSFGALVSAVDDIESLGFELDGVDKIVMPATEREISKLFQREQFDINQPDLRHEVHIMIEDYEQAPKKAVIANPTSDNVISLDF